MGVDSKVKRYVRRLKRENSLLYREAEIRQAQMQQLAQMVMKSQQDWKDLKATLEASEAEAQPTPEFTITQVEDETERPRDYAMNTTGMTEEEIAAAHQRFAEEDARDNSATA